MAWIVDVDCGATSNRALNKPISLFSFRGDWTNGVVVIADGYGKDKMAMFTLFILQRRHEILPRKAMMK